MNLHRTLCVCVCVCVFLACVSQFFDTCNDTGAIDAAGWEAILLPLFKPILAASTLPELFATLGWLQLSGLAPTALISPLLQTEQHVRALHRPDLMSPPPPPCFITSSFRSSRHISLSPLRLPTQPVIHYLPCVCASYPSFRPSAPPPLRPPPTFLPVRRPVRAVHHAWLRLLP